MIPGNEREQKGRKEIVKMQWKLKDKSLEREETDRLKKTSLRWKSLRKAEKCEYQ